MLGLPLGLTYSSGKNVLVGPGAGALLMETADFFLMEDGTSHFIFE